MTPREVMIKAMHDAVLGNYGHDLPDEEFAHDVDRQLDALKDAGFSISSLSGFIENDLVRALFALKEIEGYLYEKEPRIGDATYTIDAVLSSFKDSEALAQATHRHKNR